MSEIVRYQNAYYSNYKVEHDKDREVLVLKRPDTDYELVEQKCLITVAGYLFRCIKENNSIVVPLLRSDHQGVPTRVFRRNFVGSVGLLSFNALSNPIETFPITEGMFTTDLLNGQDPFQPGQIDPSLHSKMYITVPHACTNPVLVLGGYIQPLDPEILTITGFSDDPDNPYTTFSLKLTNINFIERLYELAQYRDIFSELGIDTANFNPEFFETNQALADDVISRFITMVNSFVIDLDINSMEIESLSLDRTTIPGSFRTQLEPILPLVVGEGKLTDYWKKKSGSGWNVYVSDWYYSNYLFSNAPEPDVVNSMRDLEQTHRITKASFLEIEMTE